MGRLRKTVEYKRQKLIEILIAFNVYKKEDEHLYQLTLTELENEYRKLQSLSHPHSELGSIHLTSKKSNNNF